MLKSYENTHETSEDRNCVIHISCDLSTEEQEAIEKHSQLNPAVPEYELFCGALIELLLGEKDLAADIEIKITPKHNSELLSLLEDDITD